MNNFELLIPDKIIKSKRKSISLIIDTSGNFIVRCPLFSSQKNVDEFITKKANWIISKRLAFKNSGFKPLKVETDEVLPIIGDQYKIELYNNNRVKIVQDKIYVPNVNSKQKLINFVKGYARIILLPKLNELSLKTNLEFKTMSISSAKTCWGSCSADNKIHFTYKLILCPEHVINYIIIHELCHTKIKNHSLNFWRLVKENYPNYKLSEQWLKEHKNVINII